MTLDGSVKLDISALSIGDLDDFRTLTGIELDAYVEQFDQEAFRNVGSWGDLMTSEMRALLWIALRDEETANRAYPTGDDLFDAMEADIRRMKVSDFERFNVSRSVQQRASRTQAPAAQRLQPLRTKARAAQEAEVI